MNAPNPIVAFKGDLSAMREAGDFAILPANVSFEAFRNAAIVAVTDNPNILRTDKGSLFRAIRRLAAAGLVPDGREAALVPFNGQAQAMPMVSGLIKIARNSGEIASIWSDVVYEGEDFRVWIEKGERRFEHNFDPLSRSGEIRGAYAVAKLKDGTIEFEPMSRTEIEKRRMSSANQKGPKPTGIWAQWYAEMARKTVIRALCKRLPMSAEDVRRIMVENDDQAFQKPETPQDAGRNLYQRLTEPDPVEGEVVSPYEALDTSGAFPGADAFTEGANAFAVGDGLAACPHPVGSQEAVDWCGGWRGAEKAKWE